MTIYDKLAILGDAAKYDVSCASSGMKENGGAGSKIGSTLAGGICHSWAEDGRCISLLKVLMTNYCVYNCAYCVNRCSNDVPRAAFSPQELASLTIEFYRRNYIEGLFLSSGVIVSPDHTMELFIKTLQILRFQYGFGGYIHVKIIPGASQELIYQAGTLANRVSINVELTSSERLALLAPQKNKTAIFRPMGQMTQMMAVSREEHKLYRCAKPFAPAGQSTQLIVGASDETDSTILTLSEAMYHKYDLKRVYYSGYIPIGTHPSLPRARVPMLREHRLYQADWLMRFYGFSSGEILSPDRPNLNLNFDPKCNWALNHLELFPVEINTADYEMILRIPGVGVKSAQRIIAARRQKQLNVDELARLGVVMKRAAYFVTAKGRFAGRVHPDSPYLPGLLDERKEEGFQQLSLFSPSEALCVG